MWPVFRVSAVILDVVIIGIRSQGSSYVGQVWGWPKLQDTRSRAQTDKRHQRGLGVASWSLEAPWALMQVTIHSGV